MTDTPSIIITGGAGFIGSAFVRLALQEGFHPIVLDALTYAGHRENLSGLEKRIQFVHDSITNYDTIAELLSKHRPRAIVNFAAESHVDNSINGPAVFIETNIIGSFTLLEAARTHYKNSSEEEQAAFRFVQISTDEVYGSLGETGKFSETSQMKPNSPYSASKAAGDHLARAWCKTYGLPVITTHCTNNYGPRQHPEKLIPHMITKALSGQPLPVYGDGQNIRDWIHVDDHCRGIMLALKKGKLGETYNFGGNAEKKNIELVQELCAYLDKVRPNPNGNSYAKQITFVKDRPGHDRRYAVDDSKARETLGYNSEYDFAGGIKATVDWYLSNQSWCDAVQGKKKAA